MISRPHDNAQIKNGDLQSTINKLKWSIRMKVRLALIKINWEEYDKDCIYHDIEGKYNIVET